MKQACQTTLRLGSIVFFCLNAISSGCELSAAWNNTGNVTGVQCDSLWLDVVQRVKQHTSAFSDTRSKHRTRGTGHKIGCHLQQEIFHQTAQHKRALLDDDLDKVEKSTIISLTNTMKSASCIPETLEERTHQGYPDLQGVQLRVITDPWPPYIIKSAHANGSYYVTGFSLDLLEEVRQLLNFTYVLEYEHDGWGQTCEDGNWSGMVGLLQRREKDLIIGALGHQPERTAVMDFSLIYDEISITMWILDPRQRPRIWLALFDMLDLAVTGLLLGTICLLSVILTLSSMTVPIGHQPESLTSCFVTKVFTLLGAILAQGSRVQQATSTGKTIIATWWMFSVVFSITYSAMLIASLSANTTQLPFDSVASMIKQTEYSYGIFGSGTEQMYFKEITNSSDYQRLWRNIESAAISDPEVLSSDYRVHAHKVTHQKYVYIGAKLPWDDFTDPYTSVLRFGDEFYKLKICFGLQLNSPYTSAISYSLAVLLQHGIVRKLKKKWFSPIPTRSTEVSDVKPIGLPTLAGVFFTASIGLGISIVALLLEVGITRLRHRRSKKIEH